MSESALTQARLKELLHYDPETGIFTYKLRFAHRIRVGDPVTSTNDNGYLRLCLRYKKYYLHRLAWLYMTGEWPLFQIDHKNTIRADNRWDNLREATNKFNNENRRSAHRTSISGLLGVRKRKNKFLARIFADGKERHLGAFDTPELAHAAYVDAKRQLHAGCTL